MKQTDHFAILQGLENRLGDLDTPDLIAAISPHWGFNDIDQARIDNGI